MSVQDRRVCNLSFFFCSLKPFVEFFVYSINKKKILHVTVFCLSKKEIALFCLFPSLLNFLPLLLFFLIFFLPKNTIVRHQPNIPLTPSPNQVTLFAPSFQQTSHHLPLSLLNRKSKKSCTVEERNVHSPCLEGIGEVLERGEKPFERLDRV